MEEEAMNNIEKQEEPEVIEKNWMLWAFSQVGKQIEKTAKNMKDWHPVLTHDFSPDIRGWDNFLRKWAAAESALEKKSLLHMGFGVKLNDPSEGQKEICFYLEAAYGYRGISGSFRLSDDRDGWYSHGVPPREMRRDVAKKAWAVLCQDFFKHFCGDDKWEDSHRPLYWHYLACDDCRILDKVLWFFREEDNLPRRVPENHHDTIALEFIVRMAEIAVTGRAIGYMQPHFVSRRHEFIKILLSLRRLDILLDNWQNLTEDDLALVKKLALQTPDIFDPKSEYWSKFKSIDEALIATTVGDRYAAQIYVQLEAMLKAQKKKDKIDELERQAEEAKQKLEQAKKV